MASQCAQRATRPPLGTMCGSPMAHTTTRTACDVLARVVACLQTVATRLCARHQRVPTGKQGVATMVQVHCGAATATRSNARQCAQVAERPCCRASL